jgi:ABC-type transport system involved in multi-copper enzyme maturation permease subunit
MELDKEAQEKMRKLDEDYENRLGRQISLCRSISRLSPYSCFVYSVTSLSRTGIGDARNFKTTLRNSREEFQENSSNLGNAVVMQEFRSRHLDLASSLSIMSADVMVLAIYCVIFFALSYVCFLRYDVR